MGKKTPAITVSQLRRLLATVLPLKEPSSRREIDVHERPRYFALSLYRVVMSGGPLSRGEEPGKSKGTVEAWHLLE